MSPSHELGIRPGEIMGNASRFGFRLPSCMIVKIAFNNTSNTASRGIKADSSPTADLIALNPSRNIVLSPLIPCTANGPTKSTALPDRFIARILPVLGFAFRHISAPCIPPHYGTEYGGGLSPLLPLLNLYNCLNNRHPVAAWALPVRWGSKIRHSETIAVYGF